MRNLRKMQGSSYFEIHPSIGSIQCTKACWCDKDNIDEKTYNKLIIYTINFNMNTQGYFVLL